MKHQQMFVHTCDLLLDTRAVLQDLAEGLAVAESPH